MIDAEGILIAELERIAPVDDVPAPDLSELRRRAGTNPRRSARRAAVALGIGLALAAVSVAAAKLIADHGSHSGRSRIYNGPLTVNGAGAVAGIGAGGRLSRLWACPHEHGCGILNGIAWSRDGWWLAYSSPQWGRTRSTSGLYVVDLHTRRQWHLSARETGCNIAYDLEWAPDGRRLAYACPGLIFLVSRHLTDREVLNTLAAGKGRRSSPTWSADGSKIAFAIRRGSGRTGHSTVYVKVLRSGHVRRLAVEATAPAWSPDGRVIAVRASCGGIELLTPDGRNITPRLRNLSCPAMGVPGLPVWSPDGRVIAIQMRPRGGIYTIDRDGRHLVRLAARGTPADTGGGAFGGDRPAWRPTHIAPREREHGDQGGV